jgi:RNA polymerase sigma factor (TIGR02999 family)
MTETELLATLNAAAAGDAAAKDRLFVLLYDELHGMARRELRRNAAMTLTATSLLHDTFLNISKRESVVFPDRPHFMVYASRAMRGLVLDYLRKRQAHKRGGEFEITSLPTTSPEALEEHVWLEELNAALEWLAKTDERLAQCVDLKFFCGFSFSEIAQMHGISERTVQRDWNKARVLLRRFMNDSTARSLTSVETCVS